MEGLFQSEQQRKSIEDYLKSKGWNPPAQNQDQQNADVMPTVVVESTQQPEYPEQLYRQKSQDLQARRNYLYSKINDASAGNSEARDFLEKRYKHILEGPLKPLPDFAETPEGKNIANFAPKYFDSVQMVNTLRNELDAATKLEDPKAKARRLQSIVPKLIQSVATNSSDALQMGEFFMGAPELTNYLNWSASRGGHSIGNLTAYLNNPTASGILETDPDEYLKKAKGIWNSAANSKNSVISMLEKTSSPEFVRRFIPDKLNPFNEDDQVAWTGATTSKTPDMIAPQQKAGAATIRYIRDQSGKLVPVR